MRKRRHQKVILWFLSSTSQATTQWVNFILWNWVSSWSRIHHHHHHDHHSYDLCSVNRKELKMRMKKKQNKTSQRTPKFKSRLLCVINWWWLFFIFLHYSPPICHIILSPLASSSSPPAPPPPSSVACHLSGRAS